MVVLAGCGKDKKPVESPSAKYGETFNQIMKSSNQLLERYGANIDKLYIDEYSAEQFSTIVREIIPTSNDIIGIAENLGVSIDLYDLHQKVIGYLNNQHQMLLTAINDSSIVANEKNKTIDKAKLRNQYIEVKNQQAALIKEWKQMISPVTEKK